MSTPALGGDRLHFLGSGESSAHSHSQPPGTHEPSEITLWATTSALEYVYRL